MHFLDSFAHFLRRPWALVDTFELSDAISAGLRAGGGELPVRFGRPPLAHNLTSAGDAPLSSFSDDSYCSKRLVSRAGPAARARPTLTTPRRWQTKVPSWHWQHAVFCSDSVDHRAALMPPFYELDTAVLRVRRHAETTGNNNTATDGLLGVPFPNVIALRSAKIRNFLEIREWIANVEHARFEDRIGQDGRGAADFIARLKADYDLPVHEGGPVLPQPPANWSPSPAARQAVEAANNASAAWPFVLRYNPKTVRVIYVDAPSLLSAVVHAPPSVRALRLRRVRVGHVPQPRRSLRQPHRRPTGSDRCRPSAAALLRCDPRRRAAVHRAAPRPRARASGRVRNEPVQLQGPLAGSAGAVGGGGGRVSVVVSS